MKLSERMKRYEHVSQNVLMNREPVIIRLDGKAFHTFTRELNKPFDEVLTNTMQNTMKYLCENIQGCVLGYTQSDEITLVLTDYANLESEAWFDYRVQKLCSVSASMCTMAFNKFFCDYAYQEFLSRKIFLAHRYRTLEDCQNLGAMFDARCFNLPKHEVVNMLIWRQQDAERNSIQSVGQAYFSHKELHKKSCNDIQNMLLLEKDINWNDLRTDWKYGSCCIKTEDRWTVDKNIPIFKNDKDYINNRIYIKEGE